MAASGKGHWQLPRGSEMQFPRPGVTRHGAHTLGRKGASSGGGASRAQRAPKRGGLPPLTLGLRLHPSLTAGERGWLGARSVLAGLRLSWRWGRAPRCGGGGGGVEGKGHIKQKNRIYGFGSLRGNPDCNSCRSRPWRLRLGAQCPKPKRKVA